MVNLASATISIVIPTKNAGAEFRETLAAIRDQTLESEIVVVDSGSSDGTLDLAREFKSHTISIAQEAFNHGETRNLGIRHARGQFCIMLVQDARPVGKTWLRDLIEPFSDQSVVGVTVRQIPREDSDPVGRWQVEYRNQFLGETVRVQELPNWDGFLALDFQERLRLVSFDNVCSAIRRDFWETCVFQPVPFAEDLDWGVRALAAGRRLVYNPAVAVIHSHSRPAEYHLRRSYISGRVVPRMLHMPPHDPGIESEAAFLESLGVLYGEVETMLAEDISDWRDFRRTCGVERSFWSQLLETAGRRQPLTNSDLRDTLYFVVDQLAGVCRRTGSQHSLSYILVQALAQSIGPFAATYYNWCEKQGILSDGMRRLDRTLSIGV